MKLVMAIPAQDKCFPATGRHHTLPERFSFRYIFQLSDVVGSGAVVPCGDRPSPARRTVRAPCQRTRLSFTRFLMDSLSGSVPA
jgi:hypothetical protein